MIAAVPPPPVPPAIERELRQGIAPHSHKWVIRTLHETVRDHSSRRGQPGRS